MERPSNLREALLAEALGDLHKLLNRADMLVPALDEARKAVDDARKALDESRKALAATARDMTAAGEGVKRQLLAEAEHTKKGALRYVADSTRLLIMGPGLGRIRSCLVDRHARLLRDSRVSQPSFETCLDAPDGLVVANLTACALPRGLRVDGRQRVEFGQGRALPGAANL